MFLGTYTHTHTHTHTHLHPYSAHRCTHTHTDTDTDIHTHVCRQTWYTHWTRSPPFHASVSVLVTVCGFQKCTEVETHLHAVEEIHRDFIFKLRFEFYGSDQDEESFWKNRWEVHKKSIASLQESFDLEIRKLRTVSFSRDCVRASHLLAFQS